jgi:long-chain acyl-CoA synthetase
VSDPLSLLPQALAAGNGSIDGAPANAYIAAGLTLLQRSAVLVRALAGRRSGILLPTTPAFLTALGASEGRGAVLMNPLATPTELAYQIADADVGAVFTSVALAERLPRGMTVVLLDAAPRNARVVSGAGTKDVDLGSHFALSLEGDANVPGSDDEVAIVYTSAMEGRPLGATLSHRNLLANARATAGAGSLSPADHMLAALPYSHLFGFVAGGVAPLLAGARVTTMARFNPLRALEQIEQHRVTMFVGVPSMYLSLLAAVEERATRRLAAHSLRLCICGGAPLDPMVQQRWKEVSGVDLRQGYGLTEASPVCLFNNVALPNVVGSLGTPYPGVEVSIREPAAFEPVRDGDTGEICVRGATVFKGYVRHPAAAPPRGLEVRDGWLRTGDLGARRRDGGIEFRGLIKRMFTRNGFNIYPRELELAIGELPGVRQVRVGAAPDALKEYAIVVEVSGTVGEDDVRQWCATRLSAYKQPSIVRIAP